MLDDFPVVLSSTDTEIFRAPYPYLPNKHIRVGGVEVCFVDARWETPRDLTANERVQFLAEIAARNRVSGELAATTQRDYSRAP